MEATAQDVAAVLAEHQPRRNSVGIVKGCGCSGRGMMVGVQAHRAHVAEHIAPLLAAEYERGLSDGRAQVAAAVEAVHQPAPHQPAATEHPWCVGCYEGAREDRHPCATIAAIAPHSDALAKHDAEVLRALADDFDSPTSPLYRMSAAEWLRDRADRIEASS